MLGCIPQSNPCNPMAGGSADITGNLTEEQQVLGPNGDGNRKPFAETHRMYMD